MVRLVMSLEANDIFYSHLLTSDMRRISEVRIFQLDLKIWGLG